MSDMHLSYGLNPAIATARPTKRGSAFAAYILSFYSCFVKVLLDSQNSATIKIRELLALVIFWQLRKLLKIWYKKKVARTKFLFKVL
jgi:hypothetical protein